MVIEGQDPPWRRVLHLYGVHQARLMRRCSPELRSLVASCTMSLKDVGSKTTSDHGILGDAWS
jgi:hypothetical protein